MIEGKSISVLDLPSKGYGYDTKDFEIFVKPLTLKEEMATSLERMGTTKSSYYENLLDSIEIKGNFDKRNLFYIDVQYIDLGRRLFSFELDEEIKVAEAYKCSFCKSTLDFSFKYEELIFSDLEEGNIGKELTFSDGLTIKIKPVSMKMFLKVVREHLTNANPDKEIQNLSNFIYAYRACAVYEVHDSKDNIKREFQSLEHMYKFMYEYLCSRYKNKDSKVMEELDKNITSTLLPLERKCQKCGEKQEVTLEPHARFQQ